MQGLSIPLPFVTALLAAGLALYLAVGRPGIDRARLIFVALFGLIALESLLVGLRFGYGLGWVLPLQRILPFWLGPLVYLGFMAMAEEGRAATRRRAVHLGVAGAATVVFSAIPPARIALDVAISFSYAVYLVLLLRLWRDGPDRLGAVPFPTAETLRRWILVAAVLIGLSLALDTAIAADFALRGGAGTVAILFWGTVLLLVLVGGAMIVLTRQHAAPATGQADPDDALVAAAGQLLDETGLYRDPELTLTRLARRLGVPDRTLSAAVNGHTGASVSTFINRRRVAEAQRLLRETDQPIDHVRREAGFMTRSNFYRVFERETGTGPGAWRDAARRAAMDSGDGGG